MKEANFNIVYTFFFFFFFFFFFRLLNLNTYVSAFNPSSSSSPCNGSIAECNEEEMEMVMESDISRRFLEEKKKYISPGALKRDQPVCNGGASGQPYSRSDGCLPQPSHTYNRGCSAYYRCRDNT